MAEQGITHYRTADESRAIAMLFGPADAATVPKPRFDDDMWMRFDAQGWDGLTLAEKTWAEMEFEAVWRRPMEDSAGNPDPNHAGGQHLK